MLLDLFTSLLTIAFVGAALGVVLLLVHLLK